MMFKVAKGDVLEGETSPFINVLLCYVFYRGFYKIKVSITLATPSSSLDSVT